jgi:hypothetical protein
MLPVSFVILRMSEDVADEHFAVVVVDEDHEAIVVTADIDDR